MEFDRDYVMCSITDSVQKQLWAAQLSSVKRDIKKTAKVYNDASLLEVFMNKAALSILTHIFFMDSFSLCYVGVAFWGPGEGMYLLAL